MTIWRRLTVIELLSLGLVLCACGADPGTGPDPEPDPEPVGVTLQFTVQPTESSAGSPVVPAIEVTIVDEVGNRVVAASNAVTVAVGSNPTGATLLGTTTIAAENGIATFADLALDRAGVGFTLHASSGTMSGAVSDGFDVFTGLGSLKAGAAYTCGVTARNATAYCWGDNSSGQLGDGTTTDRLTPVEVALTGPAFDQVDSRNLGVTCGVTTDHAAYCWGLNNSGQLGDGTTIDRMAPVAVTGGLSFASVSSGSSHTCGVTVDGDAYCWGGDGVGQLGDGTPTTSPNPEPVLVSGGLSFTSVVIGASHSCGITMDRTAYCWGSNQTGSLGDGTYDNSASPVPVYGGLQFVSLSTALFGTCGLTTEGASYCWGGKYPNLVYASRPQAVAEGWTFASLSHGGQHTCGVTADGTGYCWGKGGGKIGIGVTQDITYTTPQKVVGEIEFASISAAGNHTCGLATSGAVYCWGSNSHGQFGNGSVGGTVAEPIRVLGPPWPF